MRNLVFNKINDESRSLIESTKSGDGAMSRSKSKSMLNASF